MQVVGGSLAGGLPAGGAVTIPVNCGTPLLRLEGVSKSYSGVQVLRDVTLELARGEVMMLVGENGAGKSTLKNIISGLTAPSSGSLVFDGKQSSAFTADMAAEYGIGTIHQELSLFSNLTVAENIFMPDLPTRSGRLDWRFMETQAGQLLSENLGSHIDPGQLVSDLSLGERQLVEIAKAIHRSSSVLILDEPTTCLSLPERETLKNVVRRLRGADYGIIYITHFLEEVYALADRIAVLRDGALVAQGDCQSLPPDALTRAMVGRDVKASSVSLAPVAGDAPVVFRAVGIGDDELVRDVSFDVRAGEVLGIAGLMGAGRSELAEMMVGLRPSGGFAEIAGKPLHQPTVQEAMRRGVVLVSEDRRRDQAFLSRPVRENLTAPRLANFVSAVVNLISRTRESEHARGITALYDVQPRNVEIEVVKLSGGNQQKAIIGRWLDTKPAICILDEPTKGVDIGARDAIHQKIADLAATGTAFILISSDLPELIDLSHRVVVLHKGRAVGQLERRELDPDKVMQMASTGASGLAAGEPAAIL